MEEITRINHVGLRVRDMNIAREFYEKLGFKFLAGPVGPERDPSSLVEIFPVIDNADASDRPNSTPVPVERKPRPRARSARIPRTSSVPTPTWRL